MEVYIVATGVSVGSSVAVTGVVPSVCWELLGGRRSVLVWVLWLGIGNVVSVVLRPLVVYYLRRPGGALV